MVKVGDLAPDFILLDEDGKNRKLAEYKGKWVLLYFYPKDDTPGCVKEACGIRDRLPSFKESGLTVIGVSVDSVESHKKFKEKYKLPFTLLSDQEKKVVSAYGVWGKKKFMGKEYFGTRRTSFLIDPQGRIRKIYENVNPETHAEEVLKYMNDIASRSVENG